jgi:VIT1/CCC1 family predicted Fe2+/Mn2+ transporter
VTISVAPPARATAVATPALTPVDRVSGVIFGLIMALTFTGTLSVATADRDEVRSMLIGALGCNIAWGLVDAVMYLLGVLAERGRNLTILEEVRARADALRARTLILDALPPLIASTMQPADVDLIRGRLESVPVPRAGLTLGDFRTALGVFLLVFLATLPVALPFAVIDHTHRALRVSNGIALLMLFVGGYYLGRHGGRRPLVSGLVMLGVGTGLVLATIALGG